MVDYGYNINPHVNPLGKAGTLYPVSTVVQRRRRQRENIVLGHRLWLGDTVGRRGRESEVFLAEGSPVVLPFRATIRISDQSNQSTLSRAPQTERGFVLTKWGFDASEILQNMYTCVFVLRSKYFPQLLTFLN